MAHVGVLQSSGNVGDWRQFARAMRAGASDDDLVSIRVDHEVGVVGDHDDLPLGLGRDEQGDQFIKDRFGIEILLGLIDDQGPMIALVERQVQEEQDNPARTRRQLCDVGAFVIDAVGDLDVVGAEQPLCETHQPASICRLIIRRYIGHREKLVLPGISEVLDRRVDGAHITCFPRLSEVGVGLLFDRALSLKIAGAPQVEKLLAERGPLLYIGMPAGRKGQLLQRALGGL